MIRNQSINFSNLISGVKKAFCSLHVSSIYLLVGIVLSALLTGLMYSPEEDDSFYASPVVHSIANPNELLDINLNWIAPWSDSNYVAPVGMEYTEGYQYFIGVISYLTNL